MSDLVKMRGAIPFPEAGDGVYLRFRASDMMKLQLQFGSGWFSDAIDRVNSVDVELIFKYAAIGAKKDEKPFEIDWDTVDVSMVDVGTKVLDGLFMAVHRTTFGEHMEKITKLINENPGATDANPPAPGPETSSIL